MRLKFILVGFVLGLFVFPYVLNIGKVEAQVGVKCINFKKPIQKLKCFRQKLRKKNQIIKALRADMRRCVDDLQTVEPAHDEIEKLHGSLDECHERKAQLGAVTKGIVGNAITNISKLKTTVSQLEGAVTKIEKRNSDLFKYITGVPYDARGGAYLERSIRTDVLNALAIQKEDIRKIDEISKRLTSLR